MAERVEIEPIAHIRTDFPSKFGIPRQSGVVESLRGRIVFEPSFRNVDYIRGIEKYTNLWLIWLFSANKHQPNSPLVRPPRLGGNTHVGVFATRSPYRPNPIGLSAVRIEKIDYDTPEGPVISVRGADLMDGTPIYDIKPYIPYADAHPEARGGFTDNNDWQPLEVIIPEEIVKAFTDTELSSLKGVLSQDPRPQYHDDPERIYGMPFASRDVKFKVDGNTLIVTGIE